MIERKEYLEKLKAFKDKNLIKVVTGIRRCGKSTMFAIYREYLLANGVKPEQIIYLNLEEGAFRGLRTADALYEYVEQRLQKARQNYIFRLSDKKSVAKHFGRL